MAHKKTSSKSLAKGEVDGNRCSEEFLTLLKLVSQMILPLCKIDEFRIKIGCFNNKFDFVVTRCTSKILYCIT